MTRPVLVLELVRAGRLGNRAGGRACDHRRFTLRRLRPERGRRRKVPARVRPLLSSRSPVGVATTTRGSASARSMSTRRCCARCCAWSRCSSGQPVPACWSRWSCGPTGAERPGLATVHVAHRQRARHLDAGHHRHAVVLRQRAGTHGGPQSIRVMLVLLAVVPGVVGTLLDIPQAAFVRSRSPSSACSAAEFPNVRFFFGIPAWVFAAVIVGIEMLQLIGLRDPNASCCCSSRWPPQRSSGAARPAGPVRMAAAHPVAGWFAERFGRHRKPRRKQSRDFDRVVSGPWAGPSPLDQHEMDRLLDKMNSVGLSDAERKRLTELGKRLRGELTSRC